MADFDFNAPYVDRRTWIIDHLQDLILEPKEILVVLLIDFFNQQHISIDHELIARPLSSTEMQRIIDMASMYDERRVICALNEAVCNEACDLNYIERILQNWQQKGLSTEDIENGKR